MRIVFNANGAVLGRQDYGPYGRPLFPATSLPPERFGGRPVDAEIDQGDFQAREYQMRTGRFTRVDPIYNGIFEPQRWNRYAYALNAPATVIDPNGMLPILTVNDPCKFLIFCTSTTVVGDYYYEPLGWWGERYIGPDRPGRITPSKPTPTSPATDQPDPGIPAPGTQDEAPKKTDCESYSEWVASNAKKAGSGVLSRTVVGGAMMFHGYNDTFQGTTTGFRPILTANYQGNDVYKHLNFIVGSAIVGAAGPIIGAVLVDSAEARFKSTALGRAQSVTEVVNDYFGIYVGIQVINASQTQNYSNLAENIKKTICK